MIKKKERFNFHNEYKIISSTKIYFSIKFLFISKKNQKKILNAIPLSILYFPVIKEKTNSQKFRLLY